MPQGNITCKTNSGGSGLVTANYQWTRDVHNIKAPIRRTNFICSVRTIFNVELSLFYTVQFNVP